MLSEVLSLVSTQILLADAVQGRFGPNCSNAATQRVSASYVDQLKTGRQLQLQILWLEGKVCARELFLEVIGLATHSYRQT